MSALLRTSKALSDAADKLKISSGIRGNIKMSKPAMALKISRANAAVTHVAASVRLAAK